MVGKWRKMDCGCLNVKAIGKGDKLNFDMFRLELQCVLMRNGMIYIVRGPSKPELICKLKRSKCPCLYYSNSYTTFNILLRAGDIEENPGPTSPKCPMCNKTVGKNMRRCVCEVCKDVAHRLTVQSLYLQSRLELITLTYGHVQTVFPRFYPSVPWGHRLSWLPLLLNDLASL